MHVRSVCVCDPSVLGECRHIGEPWPRGVDDGGALSVEPLCMRGSTKHQTDVSRPRSPKGIRSSLLAPYANAPQGRLAAGSAAAALAVLARKSHDRLARNYPPSITTRCPRIGTPSASNRSRLLGPLCPRAVGPDHAPPTDAGRHLRKDASGVSRGSRCEIPIGRYVPAGTRRTRPRIVSAVNATGSRPPAHTPSESPAVAWREPRRRRRTSARRRSRSMNL